MPAQNPPPPAILALSGLPATGNFDVIGDHATLPQRWSRWTIVTANLVTMLRKSRTWRANLGNSEDIIRVQKRNDIDDCQSSHKVTKIQDGKMDGWMDGCSTTSPASNGPIQGIHDLTMSAWCIMNCGCMFRVKAVGHFANIIFCVRCDCHQRK